ncbi:MAG: hypothetical protein PHO12_09605, partial [Bacteroidales bacterium]|nr:hypothetical protein [Bacteroidales bacterium]
MNPVNPDSDKRLSTKQTRLSVGLSTFDLRLATFFNFEENKKPMKNIKIAVIGLGYVGLPLARLFSTKYPTIGYDINQSRVTRLMQGVDDTLEVEDNI